MTMEKMNVA